MSSLDAPKYNWSLLLTFLSGGELNDLMETDNKFRTAFLEKLAVARLNIRSPYSSPTWTEDDPVIWDISQKLNLYRHRII